VDAAQVGPDRVQRDEQLGRDLRSAEVAGHVRGLARSCDNPSCRSSMCEMLEQRLQPSE
jgi:hypothetical protein